MGTEIPMTEWTPGDDCPQCGGMVTEEDIWDDLEENGGACIAIVYECTKCEWETEKV